MPVGQELVIKDCAFFAIGVRCDNLVQPDAVMGQSSRELIPFNCSMLGRFSRTYPAAKETTNRMNICIKHLCISFVGPHVPALRFLVVKTLS
jgi:hypothetical protein